MSPLYAPDAQPFDRPAQSWTHDRARVAALSRSRTADDPELAAARRDLRATRAEDYIRALVDAAPPLTDEQRRRLSVLLHPEAAA